MFPASKALKFYLFILFGVIIGLCIPFVFILLDLKQLRLAFDFTNLYEVFQSQNIYFVSSILFPVLFGIIFGLYFLTFSQNKKLAGQERYIKIILNSLNDCILVCDSAGKINYANRIFYKSYENPLNSIKSLLGITNLSLVPAGHFFESSLFTRKGEKRSVNYIVYKLQDKLSSSFKSDSFIVSIRDIEEQKRNEKIIESQTTQLFEASKLSALGEMASGFAHEINNPLTIIKGKLMLTEREVRKDEINKNAVLHYLKTCNKMIERITKIIIALRNLSHSNIDEFETILIKDLVEDSINMAHLKISGKVIDFKVDIASVLNEKIVCNPIQISQVLLNLFSNSIDAIELQSHPWLSLTITLDDSGFKFTIIDSGNGIPMDVQKRMFEPMFTTKPVGKGTGLGLSISRAIIEKHKGKIALNNNYPNTCFEFILPKDFRMQLEKEKPSEDGFHFLQ